MKRVYFIVLLLVFGMMIPCTLTAQHFDPKHIHSIEITSGCAPLRTTFKGDASYLDTSWSDKGQNYSVLWWPSINLAYSLAVDELWDIHVIVNYSCQRIRVKQFKILEEGDPHPVVDWKSAPIASWKQTIRSSFAVMADFRLKWFRRDWCTLYSALGIGFPFVSMKPAITPYVTPIGFRAGGKHFYGLIELNLSSASTLGHAGIGYRF